MREIPLVWNGIIRCKDEGVFELRWTGGLAAAEEQALTYLYQAQSRFF